MLLVVEIGRSQSEGLIKNCHLGVLTGDESPIDCHVQLQQQHYSEI